MREVQESGDPVSVVARRHDMNANHLFIWVKHAQQGRLGRANPLSETPPIAFIDMGVVGPGLHDVEPEESAPARSHSEVPVTTSQAVSTGGRMEIVGANGRRVIVVLRFANPEPALRFHLRGTVSPKGWSADRRLPSGC